MTTLLLESVDAISYPVLINSNCSEDNGSKGMIDEGIKWPLILPYKAVFPTSCRVEGCFAFYLPLTPIPRAIAFPLRVALHSEYTVSTYSPLSRSLPFVSVIVSLAFRFLFLLGWIFLISLSGEIIFVFVFCSLYPGRLLFNSLLPSCPADHGPDRQPHFVFSRWINIRLGPDRLM